MRGFGSEGRGVAGYSDTGAGVYGHSNSSYAGYLDGDVRIIGYLQKGGGSFKTTHSIELTNIFVTLLSNHQI